jgi:hypothetical protein
MSKREEMYRDNTVLYRTILFCIIHECSVLHEYFQQETTQSGPLTSPRFPLGQKRRKHIQEALVKETVLMKGLNKEVALCWK